MNRLTVTALSTVVLLAMLPGCPSTPEPIDTASAPDTNLAAASEICETLPPADTATTTAGDSARTKPGPGPEPRPEPKPGPEPEPPPPSKPKVLPRMWDFGSTNCQPCITMKAILDPMMVDYKGKVDIRIVNVYEEQEAARQARIQIIPTQIFYDPEGKELYRHVGVYPRDSIVAKFKEYGWE